MRKLPLLLAVMLLGWGTAASAAPYALVQDISLVFGQWDGMYTYSEPGGKDKISAMSLYIGDSLPLALPGMGYFLTESPADHASSWTGTWSFGTDPQTGTFSAEILNSYEIRYTSVSDPDATGGYSVEEYLLSFDSGYSSLVWTGTGTWYDSGVAAGTYSIIGTFAPVAPLPGSSVLLACGLLGLGWLRRRREVRFLS